METLEISQRASRRLEVCSQMQTGKLAFGTAGELWGVSYHF